MTVKEGKKAGRNAMSLQILIERREQLNEIVAHHHEGGRDHMSMTKVIEQLIKREHRRLKLSGDD